MFKKIVSLAVASMLLFGGMAAVAPGTVSAAASTVGVVDPAVLLNQHPDMAKASEAIRAEAAAAKQEFDSKASGLSDQDKHALDLELGKRVGQKQNELLKPIIDSINAAIKDVADAKGLTTVVAKGSVLYGGQDITDEVMKKITGK